MGLQARSTVEEVTGENITIAGSGPFSEVFTDTIAPEKVYSFTSIDHGISLPSGDPIQHGLIGSLRLRITVSATYGAVPGTVGAILENFTPELLNAAGTTVLETLNTISGRFTYIDTTTIATNVSYTYSGIYRFYSLGIAGPFSEPAAVLRYSMSLTAPGMNSGILPFSVTVAIPATMGFTPAS